MLGLLTESGGVEAELRRLESEASIARILVARPPQTAEWEAISDRLRRAASDGGRDDR